MLKNLFEVATGRWGLLAIGLVAFPGGRKFLRSAGKETLRAGVMLGDRLKEWTSEIKEEANDIVAEVRAEQKEAGQNIDIPKAAKTSHRSA
jgi:hypothetical protein